MNSPETVSKLNSKTSWRKTFWSRFSKSSGCWEWNGFLNEKGYGRMCIAGSSYFSHRLSWFIHFGEWPELCVLHTCDNRKCVNPDHLFLGTNKDNVDDRVKKGRSARVTGDKNGARARPDLHPRGERSGLAKITEAIVISLREEWNSGIRQIDLAAKYGITQAHVSAICQKKSWAHVKG